MLTTNQFFPQKTSPTSPTSRQFPGSTGTGEVRTLTGREAVTAVSIPVKMASKAIGSMGKIIGNIHYSTCNME